MLSQSPGSKRARGTHRRRTSLIAITAAAMLTGTLAATSTSAFAAAKPQKTSSNPYSQYYSQLTTLEKGASGGSLTETGSSLFFPLLSSWATQKPLGISLTTASTSSGVGKTAAETGTADIGASDAYLLPSDPTTVVNVPVVVSAQEVAYNVPGISRSTHLHFDAVVLDGIYEGSISTWNASPIEKLNPGVSLPSTPIVPIHRSGSAGDTFLFTSYLAAQDPSSFVSSSGPSSSAVFPNVSSALAEGGNQAMYQTCSVTPGCIAYIGSSYLREVQANLGVAELLNGYNKHDGKPSYVYPAPANIVDEVNGFQHVPASGTISLIDGHSAKNGYPIVNFEYAIVSKTDSHAADLKAFLAWAMDPRNGATVANLAPYYFHPLPPVALGVAISILGEIS